MSMKNASFDSDIGAFVAGHLRKNRRLRRWEHHHGRTETVPETGGTHARDTIQQCRMSTRAFGAGQLNADPQDLRSPCRAVTARRTLFSHQAWRGQASKVISGWLRPYRAQVAPGPAQADKKHRLPVSNCNKYYQVQSSDGCWSIAQAQSITSTRFLALNPYVDAECHNLRLGYHVCVGV
jgi:hypothetical protein